MVSGAEDSSGFRPSAYQGAPRGRVPADGSEVMPDVCWDGERRPEATPGRADPREQRRRRGVSPGCAGAPEGRLAPTAA